MAATFVCVFIAFSVCVDGGRMKKGQVETGDVVRVMPNTSPLQELGELVAKAVALRAEFKQWTGSGEDGKGLDCDDVEDDEYDYPICTALTGMAGILKDRAEIVDTWTYPIQQAQERTKTLFGGPDEAVLKAAMDKGAHKAKSAIEAVDDSFDLEAAVETFIGSTKEPLNALNALAKPSVESLEAAIARAIIIKAVFQARAGIEDLEEYKAHARIMGALLPVDQAEKQLGGMMERIEKMIE